MMDKVKLEKVKWVVEGEADLEAVGEMEARVKVKKGIGDRTYPKCPLWSQSKQLLLPLATILVTMLNS
nr:hypothetical protein CFP56_62993 [Quercus suber]